MPLKNVCSMRSMGLSEKVEANLVSFFDFGLLDKGGYFNIDINQTGDYVSNLSSLTKVVDNRGFTYWAGPKNWVYESGADSSGVNAPAQIYLNGSGSPYVSGTINYREGYVYNLPAATTGVRAEFSYKWVTCVSAKKSGYGRSIKSNTNRIDLDPVARSGAPEYSITLPFVSFDVPSISESKPFGLGSSLQPMQYTYNTKVTVVGESPDDVKRIADILVKQQQYPINTFDPETVTSSGAYPLTINGNLNSGKTHDQLATLYPWDQIWINKVKSVDGAEMKNGLFQSVISMQLVVIGCGCS